MKHVRLDTISIKDHPELNEAWIQKVIGEDPSILGLGDVLLRDKERRQPRAGRLDLLLQDPDSNKRYEVEIQLGSSDESHIIRTIEYWDLERKLYPQYDHCGVLVAEDITSRFLNVVSLFNGMIPLIGIQMKAVETSEGIGLFFTKVLDEMALGMPDEGEELREVADRDYWIARGSEKTVAMADRVLEIVQSFDPDLEFKYNKYYIGLAKGGVPNNFVACKPKKQWMNVEVRLPEDQALTNELEDAGLDIEYLTKWGKYRIRIKEGDLQSHKMMVEDLFRRAHSNSEA